MLGYYQDAARGVGVMILQNVGKPVAVVRRQRPEVLVEQRYVRKAVVMDWSDLNDRAKFLATLDAIHAAGVLHRDIRGWNVMVDDFDEAYVIDFDRASLVGTPEDYAKERARLGYLIDGLHVHDSLIGKEYILSSIDEIVAKNQVHIDIVE